MAKPAKIFIHGLRRLLLPFGYRVVKESASLCFENLLGRMLAARGGLTFVQVGANDGRLNDSLYPFLCRHRARVEGLVVEPLPDVFSRLCRTYRRFPRVKPVNLAIHNSESRMKLYRVSPAAAGKLPRWTSGIASFRSDHHCLSGLSSEHIVAQEVDCVSLEELLGRHGLDRLDLLQIDAEGYDAEILFALDFRRLAPSVIRFEHGLSQKIMNRAEFSRLVRFLDDGGYQVFLEKQNAVAYRVVEFLDFLIPEPGNSPAGTA